MQTCFKYQIDKSARMSKVARCLNAKMQKGTQVELQNIATLKMKKVETSQCQHVNM